MSMTIGAMPARAAPALTGEEPRLALVIVAPSSAKLWFDEDEVVNGTERQFPSRLRAKLAARQGKGLSAAFVRLQTGN